MAIDSFGLVVPLYNEAERFDEYSQLLADFIAKQPPGSELLFVDDGSSDGTLFAVNELVARSTHVRLLTRPHEGKGAAVGAGLREVCGDYLGFCDLDLSTPLDQFERVMHAATRAPVLAAGSRDLATSRLLRSQSKVREALGRSYNRFLQATITPGIVDTQCGAKVAVRSVWEQILPYCHELGYAWDAEAIAVALAIGIVVQEVPIEWRHDDRSKVNVFSDGTAMLMATRRISRNARLAANDKRAARGGEVFDDANAELLMEADSDHWWFRSKAALVATALQRVDRVAGDTGWLVDVGAGAGGVTALLGWDPERLLVIEGNESLVRKARSSHGLDGVRADVTLLPLSKEACSVLCLLDVIEHLDDPVPALMEAARALKPGGTLVVNVPAHQWLWSAADETLGHARRYTRSALRQDLAAAGFEPLLLTHVFSWLVPAVWLKRRVTSRDTAELGLDQTSPWLDRIAMVFTRVERALLGRVTLPFGTSVLCIAQPVPQRDSIKVPK